MNGTHIKRARISSGVLTADVMEYGAVLADVRLDGVAHGLTLSLPSLEAYQRDDAHIGAIAGPVAGRIAGGRFEIDGCVSHTTRNDGENTLHGGGQGFGCQDWTLAERGPDFALLTLFRDDGAAGFPGPMQASCLYQVVDNRLSITLEATTARPTLCNLAQHSYFNLSGAGVIDDHNLLVASNQITPFGADLLPTGTIETAPKDLDFLQRRAIGTTAIDAHFVLSDTRREPRFAAALSSESVSMRLSTTEPGLVIYTADMLNTPPFGPRSGICLEPQSWPDAINQPNFPSMILRPQEVYHQETILEFMAT
ncbi:MAG: aldose epimerase family protein [Pikeienuella sp.]